MDITWTILFASKIIMCIYKDKKYYVKCKDKYIIIDQNKIYHLGHSIKDLGRKIFSISESDNKLITKLLNNI